jgi:putative MFS transporter
MTIEQAMMSTPDRLDRLPAIRYHYVVLVLSTIALTFITYNSFILPLTIQQLPKAWTASYSLGVFLTVNALGPTTGALVFGVFADRIGRKLGMEIVLLLCSIPNGLAAFVPDPSTFLAIRFIGLLGVGGFQPIVITYISEFTPPKLRGRFIGIVLSGMGWGPLLISLSGLFLTPLLGWRGPYLLCFIPLLVLPFTYVCLYESPRYLLSQGKEEEAARIMRELEKKAKVEPHELLKEPSIRPSDSVRGFRQSFSVMFSRPWRLKTVAFVVSNAVLFFSFAGWTQWFPSISVMIGYSVGATYVILIVTSIAQVAGFFAGAFAADAIGRRRTIFISVPIWALAAFVSPFTANIIELGLVSCVLCFSVNACTPALFSYINESYPTAFRATATSVVRTIAAVGAVISPGTLALLLQSFEGSMGIIWSFVLMGITALVGAIAVYPVKVETAGLSLEVTSGRAPHDARPQFHGCLDTPKSSLEPPSLRDPSTSGNT